MNCLFKSRNSLRYLVHWKFYKSSSSNSSNITASSPKITVPELPNKEYQPAVRIKAKGKIYDKKPFKMHCEKGKLYSWCACGRSRSQPFCDGSHNDKRLGPPSPLKPIKFIPVESNDYWFCNCKQTNNRPFCDGSHKKPEIQEAIKY